MSTNIVLPSLSKWTEEHISAIYTSTSQPDTSNALDNFLSKDAVITVNGEKISRVDLTKGLQTEKFLEAGAIVTFNNIVEVPDDKDDPIKVIYLTFISIQISIKLIYGHRSGRVSWNFLHRYHSRNYQSQRCACEPYSHRLSQCCVCF